MKEVLSYGGGVQSAAIAVLIASGRLPVPELAVIADTGREPRATWDYLRDVIQPRLGDRLRIEIAPHALATVDLYGKNGDMLLPAFTEGGGKLRTLCSNEWKRRVVLRWLRARGVQRARLWFGITTDELERARTSDLGWIEHYYPLLFEIPMTRAEARQVVLSAGLPDPPRSSCWMCPHRSDAEWRALPPGEMEQAVTLDARMRERHPGTFLHRAMRPLAEAIQPHDDAQQEIPCEAGWCWT